MTFIQLLLSQNGDYIFWVHLAGSEVPVSTLSFITLIEKIRIASPQTAINNKTLHPYTQFPYLHHSRANVRVVSYAGGRVALQFLSHK